jgi:hypothetical protein
MAAVGHHGLTKAGTSRGGSVIYKVNVDAPIKVRFTIWNSQGGILVRRTAHR